MRKLREEPRRGEGGFTLVELLIGTTVLLGAIFATLTTLQTVMDTEPTITERGLRIDEARVALTRMTQELRQTYDLNTTGTSELVFFTYRRVTEGQPATKVRVRYKCDTQKCTREETTPNGEFTDPPVTVVEGILNSNVFFYEPDTINPEYVTMRLSFEVANQERDLVIEDGVNLRNATNFDD